MSDENATFLNPEAQVSGDINPEVQISGEINPEAEITADLESVIEVSHTYRGVDTDDIQMNVDNHEYTISAVKKTYIHEQAMASAVWEINHNLNRYPSITVVDSAGDVVSCDPKYIDENNVRIEFSAEFGGKAYLN